MFIYAIGTKGRHQKIGFSSNPEKRLKTLQTGNSEKLYIHYIVKCQSKIVRKLEKKIHLDLSYKKLKGEWFDLSPSEVKDYLIFVETTWLDKSFIDH